MTTTIVRTAALVLSLAATPAMAATVTYESAQFSATKPIAHFHYDGEVLPGDLEQLAAVIGEVIDCDPATLPASGGNCAVVTLNSPGGNYVEGLNMARFFRENAIATWIVSGSNCYSACAFAFMGGTGHAATNGIGDYIDRTLEPGGTLGFHAPYVASDSLGELVAEFGLEEILGGNRDSIALMIQELVSWNVDDGVLARVTSMGADDAYTASLAQDYHLLRVALPDTPLRLWEPDPAEALRNACTRLLAEYNTVWPFDVMDQLSGPIGYNIGVDEQGRALTGYQLTDSPSGITLSYCATHASDAHLAGDADISLYFGKGIDGYMRPALTFFHRPDGWSTLGAGGVAAQRLFQRGTMGHVFLAPDAEMDGLPTISWLLTVDEFMTTGHIVE